MSIRTTLGGQLEAVLNNLVDEQSKKLTVESIMDALKPVVEKAVGDKLEGIVLKVKEAIDLIDGEKDLK